MRNKKVFWSSLILLLAGLTACFTMSSDNPEKAEDHKPQVAAFTVTPETPEKVSFCNQEIDLRRYNMREGYDREISSFTYFHSTTLLLFKRANRYFPIIEPILKAHDIPDDFKYMAVIESSLNVNTVSPAKAVGIWQILSGTGKQYSLVITNTIDERRHVAKSTEAACKYLKDAYRKYGDWVNVAASYNAGMGRISSSLTNQQVDSSFDLWLVEETSRYVFRMMAIKAIFENPYKYGFVIRPHDLYKPITCHSDEVSANIPQLVSYAKNKGITYADLKRFNSWLISDNLEVGGKSYQIDIPDKESMMYDLPNSYVHDKRWIAE